MLTGSELRDKVLKWGQKVLNGVRNEDEGRVHDHSSLRSGGGESKNHQQKTINFPDVTESKILIHVDKLSSQSSN